ncbi:myeloid leukemia factor isoform X1 [Colias croceus]|uniref:myeloid leukemia factor isoform X1 n=1 Tax=Colias crocea TaxID=72248 RepID=UPI001E27D61F|nr:myeloid leukemia factor isoform X1 [Colias croceus]
MSLFGSLMADVEDDPFFGSHMRHMRQMSNMMNSIFSDPFCMLGEGTLSLMGPRHGSALMPFMPQMPSMNTLFAANNISDGSMGPGTSFSSSTVVMSSGPNGKPQVYSSSSSTKIGPNGVKETRKTLQDSRTGVKKMSIGHHIGERAHVIEREQNVYSGDAEERQEFINLEEDEAEQFDREFQERAARGAAARSARAITSSAHTHSHSHTPRHEPRLALPAPPVATEAPRRTRPSARRPLRTTANPLATSSRSGVREMYGGSHPQRHRHKHHKSHRHSPADN